MVAFGHTAFGAAIGFAGYHFFGQSNPLLGLVCTGSTAFLAHYLEDAIPHGHFFPVKDYRKKIIYVIIFDLFLSIALFSAKGFLDFGLNLRLLYILVGIFGSQLPDAFDGLIYIGILKRGGLLKTENAFHQAVHWHGVGKKTLLLGLRDFWQVAAVLAAFLLV